MASGFASRTAALLVLVSGALVGTSPAQAQLGIGAGLNFNDFDDIETGSAEAVFEGSTGYHVGVFYDVGLGPLDFRPGVFYHRLGEFEFPDGEELELSAVEVPLDVRFQPVSIPALRPYLLGAPVLSFGRTGSDFSDAVEDLNLTADVGVGVELSLPGSGATLMPEFRYGIAVTDYLSESFQVGDTTIHPASGARRPSKVMLRLNVVF